MRSWLKFLGWVIGILGVILLALYFGLYDVWRVPADDKQLAIAIQPTLQAGDVVLIARHGQPSFGQLARCADPDQPGRFVVGRLVGQQNDVVDLNQESLMVNNKHEVSPGPCEGGAAVVLVNPANQDEVNLNCGREEFAGMSHGILTAAAGETPEENTHAVVEPGRVYLLSDNRHLHQDSRDFGQIDPATCQHITYRLWSAAGWGDAAHRLTFIW